MNESHFKYTNFNAILYYCYKTKHSMLLANPYIDLVMLLLQYPSQLYIVHETGYFTIKFNTCPTLHPVHCIKVIQDAYKSSHYIKKVQDITQKSQINYTHLSHG